MKKRILSKIVFYLLILSLINYIGCYSMQKVTKDEFFLTSEYPDLIVKTDNRIEYIFDESNYSVKNDTIYGKGESKLKVEQKYIYEQFEGSISINDVDEIRIDKFDITATIVLVVAISGIGAALSAAFESGLAKIGEQSK